MLSCSWILALRDSFQYRRINCLLKFGMNNCTLVSRNSLEDSSDVSVGPGCCGRHGRTFFHPNLHRISMRHQWLLINCECDTLHEGLPPMTYLLTGLTISTATRPRSGPREPSSQS